MGEPRFSIIIPVYNVEKYIRRCMASVMNQSFRDYEVIVVDDESPDNSMQIVAEFSERYPGMITMIHQKNTRQGGARNHGVWKARGEYLLFVDSDDYVREDLLEKVDEQLKIHDCDILSFKFSMVTPEGRYCGEGGIGSLQPGVYTPKIDKSVLLLPVGPVQKAYRRSFYLESGFQFPEKILYEDVMVRFLYAKAESIVLYDECLYYYVQSDNSSIRQEPSEKMLDILKVTDHMLHEFKKADLYEVFREPLEAAAIQNIMFVLDLINAVQRESLLQIPIADYINDHFPDFRINPYLIESMKPAVECVLAHDFCNYHKRFLRRTLFRERIMQWRFVQYLNRIRRQIQMKL